ncbi:MAG: nuclear transport factor 2 family protein [Bacteroidales bacterium]|nr:nuclear transport factor 2 family protein [Candidatus Latescibacterota bacterium]
MKITILASVLFLLASVPGIVLGQDAVSEILEMLDYQVVSWNSGSIDGYMSGYWKSDSLRFHSGKKILMGWSTVKSMYDEKYSGDQRGELRFSGLRVELLSGDSAFVCGHWHVALEAGDREGLFTLLIRRKIDGWKIVHDHSS